MKKKDIALFLSLAMLLTLFVGCANSKDSEKKLQKVTLNEVAHSIFYAPMYVAIEKDYFKDEGIDLELVTGFGADKTMTAVLSNEADIGFMGPETTVYTYNEGANDKIVNFAQLTQRAGNFLVAREEMPDFRWEDLKGGKFLVVGQVTDTAPCNRLIVILRFYFSIFIFHFCSCPISAHVRWHLHR